MFKSDIEDKCGRDHVLLGRRFVVYLLLLWSAVAGCAYQYETVVIQVIDGQSQRPITDGIVSAVYGPRVLTPAEKPHNEHFPLDGSGVARPSVVLEGSCNLIIAANGYERQVIALDRELPPKQASPATPDLMVHYYVPLVGEAALKQH